MLPDVRNGKFYYGTVRSLCLYILFKHDFEIYNLEMGLHVILLETVMFYKSNKNTILLQYCHRSVQFPIHGYSCTSLEIQNYLDLA